MNQPVNIEYYQEIVDLYDSIEWMVDILISLDDDDDSSVQYVSPNLLDGWEGEIERIGDRILELNDEHKYETNL